MPIVAGAAATPIPPPVRPGRDTDGLTAYWVDPTGRQWDLSGRVGSAQWWTMPGVKGVQSAVPITITVDDRARGGTTVRHIQSGPRLVTWPLRIRGDGSYMGFVDNRRDLIDAISRTSEDGPGWLVIARPDGTSRRIAAYYQEGFEETNDDEGIRYDSPVLTLYCPDPWWQDPELTTVIRQGAPGGADFFNPYPTVSSSQTLGSTTVTNSGQGRAWPVWTVKGPASLITAANTTLGLSWTLDPTKVLGSALVAGQTVVLSGDPPTVTGPGADSWTPALDWAHSDLWPLERGDNAVDFEVSGSGAGTSIVMSYARRWRSA